MVKEKVCKFCGIENNAGHHCSGKLAFANGKKVMRKEIIDYLSGIEKYYSTEFYSEVTFKESKQFGTIIDRVSAQMSRHIINQLKMELESSSYSIK